MARKQPPKKKTLTTRVNGLEKAMTEMAKAQTGTFRLIAKISKEADKRFARIEERIATAEEHIAAAEKRIATVNEALDTRIANLVSAIGVLISRMPIPPQAPPHAGGTH